MKVRTAARTSRLFAPQLVALVSSMDKRGKPNVATIAWAMTASFEPQMVAISVGHTRYTHECISHTAEFVVNLPTADIVDKVQAAGTYSGRDTDKFKACGLTPAPPIAVKTPLVAECAAHIECRLAVRMEAGDHTIFIGEAVAASCDDGAVKDGFLDIDAVSPLLHLGGPRYATAVRIDR